MADEQDPKVVKSDAEWRATLSPEQYAVAREKGTERAFSGAYWNTKEPGKYLCACCGTELFSSDSKYDSGSGWPSFWAPVGQDRVGLVDDVTHGMRRTEVVCDRCGAHLGHVFPDGPKPSGERYCINSASLAFKPSSGG